MGSVSSTQRGAVGAVIPTGDRATVYPGAKSKSRLFGGSKAKVQSAPLYYYDTFNSISDLERTLQQILKDAGEQKKLLEFLRKEFSSELLDCYRTLHRFQELHRTTDVVVDIESQQRMNAQARVISDKHIRTGAEDEVNCAPRFKRQIEAELAGGGDCRAPFAALMRELLIMIAKDKLQRFVTQRRAAPDVERRCSRASDPLQRARLMRRLNPNCEGCHMAPEAMRPSLALQDLDYPPEDRASEVQPPFDRYLVGSVSCHGQRLGRYKINQDRGLVARGLRTAIAGSRCAVFLVADGHGDAGHFVADYAIKSVFEEVLARLSGQTPKQGRHTTQAMSHVEMVLWQAFVAADAALEDLDVLGVDRNASGTTMLAAVLLESTLYVASSGDTKLVLARAEADGYTLGGAGDREATADASYSPSRRGLSRSIEHVSCELTAVQCSEEHTISVSLEAERVESHGGVIEPAPGYASNRIWFDATCTAPGLQPTRALGDHAARSIGVIADPTTKSFALTKRDIFFIVASDGVWEYVSNKQAVKFVEAYLRLHADDADRAEGAAKHLCKIAERYWNNEEKTYCDDITAIVVVLPPYEER